MADMWMDVDTALSEVPVNVLPLLDDTDFKTRETAVAYNASGMDLVWNFVTTNGGFTQTAVTPTTAGTYDWTHQGDGMYTIEIPASGGASINNDTEGFGWFTGVATGVLPWRGPIIGFRAAALNNALIDAGATAQLEVNVVKWLGTTVETPAVAGRPAVDAVKVGGNDPETAASIADGVWDEATSGHLTQGTFGELFAGIAFGTCNGTGSSTTITLAAGASSTDDIYNGALIKIVAGTGSIQRRWITDYTGSTRAATVDSAISTDLTSRYVII